MSIKSIINIVPGDNSFPDYQLCIGHEINPLLESLPYRTLEFYLSNNHF